MHCDVDKAKAEVMAAKEKSMEAKPESEEAEKELKAAREKEMEAKEELRKASAELDKRTMEGRHVRNQKLVVEREVKHKELVAKRATKAAADKLKEYTKVKDEVDGLNKTNALREHGQCRAMFGDCGPVAPPKLTKYMACCIEGCVCKWKGAFYAQCSPPPGKGGCDPAGEQEHIKERTETMEKLKRQSELLESRRVSSKKSYEEADEKANDIRHKAAQAGTRRVQAHAVMMKKKNIARSFTNIARSKARMAIHKKHKVHYTEIAVKAWEAAAGED